MNTTLQQVVFEEQYNCVVQEKPLTSELQDHQVLVRSLVSQVSTGTEMSMYLKTHLGFDDPNNNYAKYPFLPGYATVGIIEETGNSVSTFSSGDLVFHSGAHASHAVCDVNKIFALPANSYAETAVFARMGQIALTGVRKANLHLGDSIVIMGMGILGLMAVNLARLEGARTIIAVDLDEGRLQQARKAGATHCVNPKDENTIQAVAQITNERFADVVIEVTGNANVVNDAVRCSRKQGTVILLGSVRHETTIDFYSTVHARGLHLIGAHETITPLEATPREPWDRRNNTQLCLDLIADGSIEVDSLISDRIKPDEAPALYDSIKQHPEQHLGVIINW